MAIGTIAAIASVIVAGAILALRLRHEQLKLGLLSLSTQGEPLSAEILQPDRDERVGEPFTVPTRSPVALPEGDHRVRLSATGKLSETLCLAWNVAACHVVLLPRQATHEHGLRRFAARLR